ncbi:MAG: hypothetical protein ACREHD_08185, partial [Pirellulales bacterium]
GQNDFKIVLTPFVFQQYQWGIGDTVIPQENPFGPSIVNFAEEAMSELIEQLVDTISRRGKIPTYEEALKDPNWRYAMTPSHNEEGQKWEGDKRADIPMHEELYYVTIWFLFNGTTLPSAAPGKTIIDAAREFFYERFRSEE